MISNPFKFLLPLFILCSYFVVPVFAQDDDVVQSDGSFELSEVPSVPQGLCAITPNYFSDHPELDTLTQQEVMSAGTELDVTSTVMRVIPQNQNCSREVRVGGETCMTCRDNLGSLTTMPMRVFTGPQAISEAPRTRLLICPHGPGTCPPWAVVWKLPNQLNLTCIYEDKGRGPPRSPMKEPMKSSLLFSAGVKLKVPCANLKSKVSPPSRRPW